MLFLFLPILNVFPIIPSTHNRNIEVEIGLVFNKYNNNEICNLNDHVCNFETSLDDANLDIPGYKVLSRRVYIFLSRNLAVKI